MKRILAIALAAVMLLSALTGCSSTATPTESTTDNTATTTSVSSTDPSTLVWALDSDIVSMDPKYAYDTTTNLVVVQVCESLLYMDPDGTLEPCLASSWECVDNTTYVYEIRNDVCFSDGTPMTMDDVLYSLDRNIGTDSYLAWMYDNVDSIEQTGDWEITVHLKQADAFWQYVPATTGGAIISKEYCEAHSDDFGTATGGILGTGAYKLDHWTNGSEVVLTKNDNYWDGGFNFDYDTVDFSIITEDTTLIKALQSGQVDFGINISMDMMDQLQGYDNLNTGSVDSYRIDYLSFNCERAPFNDKYVRQAVAYAIDAASICDNIYGNYGTASTGLLFSPALYTIGDASEWESYCSNVDYYSYNVDKAKEALSKSAYPNGFDCSISVSNISYYQSMAVYIQSCLSAIGINCDVDMRSHDEMITLQFGGDLDENGYKNYDMALFDWQSDFPDPAGNVYPILLGSNAGNGGSNSASFKNDDLDQILRAEQASVDPEERVQLLEQANDIILDEMPMYILCFSGMTYAENTKLQSFEPSPAYVWDLVVKNFKSAS